MYFPRLLSSFIFVHESITSAGPLNFNDDTEESEIRKAGNTAKFICLMNSCVRKVCGGWKEALSLSLARSLSLSLVQSWK